MAERWRLLIDPDADGAGNMATDEALLDAYLTDAGGAAPPTLRLYGWKPAALSLGRGQEAQDGHDREFLAREGLGLVRRPTGGRAVLHEDERTYSVTGRLDRPPFDAGVLSTYRRISQALLLAIDALGVSGIRAVQRASRSAPGPVCFAGSSLHELEWDHKKVIGSAQMRRRQAFLQHGSIPLHASAERLGRAVGSAADGARFTDLATALGREPDPGELDRALIEGFEGCFGVALVPGRHTAWENERRERLRCWKYLSANWTYRGKIDSVARRHVH